MQLNDAVIDIVVSGIVGFRFVYDDVLFDAVVAGAVRQSLFALLLGSGTPECVVDCSVFEQSGKDEYKAHDQIDIDCFDVTDSRQRRSNSR